MLNDRKQLESDLDLQIGRNGSSLYYDIAYGTGHPVNRTYLAGLIRVRERMDCFNNEKAIAVATNLLTKSK